MALAERATKAANRAEPDELVLEAQAPARRIVLPVSVIDADSLGVGEMLDMAEVLGTDLNGLSKIMRAGGIPQARVLVGYAWILVRRLEPGVTWDEAQGWRIEVRGEPIADPSAGAPAPSEMPSLPALPSQPAGLPAKSEP